MSAPPLLRSFAVENYRAFDRRTEVELRPLTLLFGYNNAGKSALVRLLPLLAESIREGGAPLMLSGPAGNGAGWSDIRCKARALQSPRVRLELELEVPAGTPDRVGFDIVGDSDNRYQYVERLWLRGGGADQEHSYEPPDVGPPPFASLVPHEPPPGTGPVFQQLAALPDAVQWLHGLRATFDRDLRLAGSASRGLDHTGQQAMELLVRGAEGPLHREVQRYFHALGEALHITSVAPSRFAVEIAPSAAPHVRVNLADTGVGHTQVLPVLVALALARLGGPHLLALEQPELHLHTHAQLALADQIVQTVQTRAGARLLVETHSEVLLAATQLAVADERLRPDQVLIYLVTAQPGGSSLVRRVELDTLGHPDGPELVGLFEEPSRLGRSLLQARRRRGA